MKMQLALPGDTSPAREIERARLVREAIGSGVDLMCDINQRWSVHQAIDIGRRLEDVHFFWWEDVTAHDDFAGIARVADALATPVAGGEYVYGIAPFRHMLEARSVDVVMIDLLRVGGDDSDFAVLANGFVGCDVESILQLMGDEDRRHVLEVPELDDLGVDRLRCDRIEAGRRVVEQ